jgi:16S rRNA processing protein RimM
LQRDRIVLKLSEVDDRSAAERLRRALVQVPVERAVRLPESTYFWHQIVGLRVEDMSGQPLGEVVEVLATGSNDVYVVRTPTGELLLPAIKQVIRGIDIERGTMSVELLPGLAP